MRQLNVRSDNIEDAGHGKRGSAMALTCDSEACVLELSPKECVRAAVASGWRRVGAACLQNPARVTPSGNFAMLGTLFAPPCSLATTLRLADPLVHPLAVWVFNMDTQLLHTWRQRSGKPSCYIVCRKWKFGNPLKPTKHALLPNCPALKVVHFDCCSDCNIRGAVWACASASVLRMFVLV